MTDLHTVTDPYSSGTCYGLSLARGTFNQLNNNYELQYSAAGAMGVRALWDVFSPEASVISTLKDAIFATATGFFGVGGLQNFVNRNYFEGCTVHQISKIENLPISQIQKMVAAHHATRGNAQDSTHTLGRSQK